MDSSSRMRGRSEEAFSLLEVLIALAVSVLIWGAIAAALNTVARSELNVVRQRRAGLMAWSLADAGAAREAPEPVFAGWRVEPASAERHDPDWDAWRIVSAGSPRAARRVYLLRVDESSLTPGGRAD